MAVIRYQIECETCDQKITLRITVGNDTFQQHNFHCPSCKEEVIVGMEVDFVNIDTNLVLIENCKIGSEEGTVFNLNPFYPLKDEEIHVDEVLPGMFRLFDFLKEKEEREGKRPSLKESEGPEILDAFSALGGTKGAVDAWVKIKKTWSLYNNQKYALVESYTPEQFVNPVTKEKDFLMWLFAFLAPFTPKGGFDRRPKFRGS